MANTSNIYEKLQLMRYELSKKDIKKTGIGRNAKFEFPYHNLSDFLPECTKIMKENKVTTHYSLDKEKATLQVINTENTEEVITFSMPVAELNITSANAVQNMGGLTTYTRRYLYMIAFDISENDEFDSNMGQSERNDPAAADQNQISKQKVGQAKVNTVRNKAASLEVSEKEICNRFEISCLEDMTEDNFKSAMEALKNTEKMRR